MSFVISTNGFISYYLLHFIYTTVILFCKSGISIIQTYNPTNYVYNAVIKNDYDFKIYPIIQSCAKVIASYNLNKIGVFATLGTVNAKAYSNEIKNVYIFYKYIHFF